jgi:hypothetical protein
LAWQVPISLACIHASPDPINIVTSCCHIGHAKKIGKHKCQAVHAGELHWLGISSGTLAFMTAIAMAY